MTRSNLIHVWRLAFFDRLSVYKAAAGHRPALRRFCLNPGPQCAIHRCLIFTRRKLNALCERLNQT